MNSLFGVKQALAKGRRLTGKFQNRYSGVKVMQEDWDVLFLLDGCWFDMFDRLNAFPGTLESRMTRGFATREFVQNNFVGHQFYDMVYVTGNPFVSLGATDAFHDVFHVWRSDWDETYGTVRPESVRDALFHAHEQHPNKCIIGHFMQPPRPFIGPSADNFREQTSGFDATRNQLLETTTSETDGVSVWKLLKYGSLSLDTAKRTYDESLKLVLNSVETVLKTVTGLPVVTSDHGNLLDKPAYDHLPLWSRRYGHPKYTSAKSLVNVLWLVQSADEHRRVTSEPPVTGRRKPKESSVEDRFNALGYK